MIHRVFPRFSGLSIATTLAAAFLVAGCLKGTEAEAQHLPDGSLRIKCQGSLAACLTRAEEICHGTTYEVLRARDQRDRYGPEMGTAQIEVRSSEALVRCGGRGRPLGGYDELKASPAEASPNNPGPRLARAPAAPPPAPAPRACVPGSTQACIGPGKCEGGQSCLPDGAAFGPCDCGTLGPPATAPSASGAGAAPAPTPTTPPGTTGAAPGAAPAPTYKPTAPPAQPLKTAPGTAPKH